MAHSRQYSDIDRLRITFSNHHPLLLHFGCGPRILKDWINIDLYSDPEKKSSKGKAVDLPAKESGTKDDLFCFNITETGLPLPDGCVDAIFHEDFFEHIDQMEQVIFLAETLRVMKKGAVHRINSPDLLISMRDHSDFSKGKDGVYIGEWNNHGHKSIPTHSYIKEMALMVGYKEVRFNSRNQSISNFIPQEFKPANDRPENGNIFADLIK